jgi:uncharacterized protein (DUF302 family)
VSDYTTAVTLDLSYDDAVPLVREALAAQGFGVLTEIDVRATMKAKLDVEVPAQVILGACRPELAHRALEATPSLGALLPCNVVVRTGTNGRTVVEAIDPQVMARMENSPVLREVADDAGRRLRAALDALGAPEPLDSLHQLAPTIEED